MSREAPKFQVATEIPAFEGRMPPMDVLMEKSVLGGLMTDQGSLSLVEEVLSPLTFYKIEHQRIYEAICALSRAHEPFDMISVVSKLKSFGILDMAGGVPYIAELASMAISTTNIEYHAKVLEEKYALREIIRAAGESYNTAYMSSSDPLTLLGEAQTAFSGIEAGLKGRTDVHTAAQLWDATIEDDWAKVNKPEDITGVPTGLDVVDHHMGGLQDTDLIILAARPSMGKGLEVTEPVATPTGFVPIGSLAVGDEVLNSYGGVSRVMGVYPQGMKPSYKVRFDEGTEIVADYSHLWSVRTRSMRKKGEGGHRTMSTMDLVNEGVLLNGKRKNYTVRQADPVWHTPTESHTINPYILGVLLGDGCFRSNRVLLSNVEEDILSEVRKHYTLRSGDGKDWRLSSYPLVEALRQYGLMGKLSHEKHIPEAYLYGDHATRLWMLRGLVDTDGHVDANTPTNIEYSTSSKLLGEQVATLVRGLGGRCSTAERMGAYTKDGIRTETRYNYRLRISFSNGIVPVSSLKHLKKFKQCRKVYSKFITNIEYIGERETVCITVDSEDSCFLAREYTVTHNTSLAVQIALNSSLKGYPTAIFSLEMGRDQIFQKVKGIYFNFPPAKLLRGPLSRHDVELMAADATLKRLPLFIEDTASLHIDTMRAKIKHLVRKEGVRLVIVDYLQLASGTGGSREQEISYIARGLKVAAKENGIPVLALAQLSRAVETRGGDKRPMLSDLRESGAIEQDADIVTFLYRPEYYDLEVDEGIKEGAAELIIAKYRTGATGTLPLLFNKKTTGFTDYETRSISKGMPRSGLFD